MNRILIATSNSGKLRDFAAMASPLGIEIASVPGSFSLPCLRSSKTASHLSRTRERKPRLTVSTPPAKSFWLTIRDWKYMP